MLNRRKKVCCLVVLSLIFIGCGGLDKKEVTEEVTEEVEEGAVIIEADSVEEGQQMLYDQAMELYEKGDYGDAIDLFNSVIKLNDSRAMIKKCKYGLAVDYFEAEQYVEAFDLFLELGVYEDAKDLAIQCFDIVPDKIFDNAKLLLRDGDAKKAENHFRWIDKNAYRVDYEFKHLWLCVLCATDMGEFSKTYKNEDSGEMCIEIDGTDVYVYSSSLVIDKGDYKIVDYKTNIDLGYDFGYPTDGFILDNGMIIHYESALEGSIVVTDIENHRSQSFISEAQAEFLVEQKRVKDEQEKKSVPYIGMSADELKKSSWGTPRDINKTTYAWGVYEQWCYSGFRYVYLEDGIVVTIQE